MRFRPPTNSVCMYRGSPASSIDSRRGNSSLNSASQLHAGQHCAEAEVHPEPEGQVLVRLAADVEARTDRRRRPRRGWPTGTTAARRRPAGTGGRATRSRSVALRMKCLTGVTQRIISSTAVPINDGSSCRRAQLVGVLDQRMQATGHRRRRRVVAGGGDDDVVRDRLHRVERLAVDGGVGDRRGQVVGRVRSPLVGQRREVHEEVVDDRDQVLQRRAPVTSPRPSAPNSSWVSASIRR